MSDPVNKATEIRAKLAQYLTQQTTQYFSDIDWLYYSNVHDPTMNPRGAIFLDEEITDRNYPNNLAINQTCYKIHLRLTISKDNLPDLLNAIDVWAAEIKNVTIKKLQCDGFEGLFKGIHFNPQRSIVKEYDKNQDEGGTGYVHYFLIWEDQGTIAENIALLV